MSLITLHCPECHQQSLHCSVAGPRGALTVTLVTQICECDPYGAWEDVWEEARELVFEAGEID